MSVGHSLSWIRIKTLDPSIELDSERITRHAVGGELAKRRQKQVEPGGDAFVAGTLQVTLGSI